MKFLPNNTLAYFNAAPQTHQHNLSELPTAVFAQSTLEYKKKCDQSSPNDDAVSFYTLNHCASIVRKLFTANEPLPAWAQSIMQSYTDVAMAQGERMLHYILCITTRETRHLKACTPAFWNKVKAKFGQEGIDILRHISNDGGEDTAMNKYLKTPPDVSIGYYTKLLAYAFHHAGQGGSGSGWSGGYGGPPWGEVTDAVVSMLDGVSSMEMLVDTGYTLAHNGGPIFNKGMMYTMYDGHFMTILDVQRSGQMLDLMFETQTLGIKKTVAAEQAALLIKTHRPSEVKGYLDWKLVDELRPQKDKDNNPNKYAKQTAAQKQATVKPKAAKAKPVLTVPEMLTLAGKKAKVTGSWKVAPHQTVKVVERTEK
jgi:hypothetical protein